MCQPDCTEWLRSTEGKVPAQGNAHESSFLFSFFFLLDDVWCLVLCVLIQGLMIKNE